MTLIVMALAMVPGFTQCKKDQPTPQNDNEGVRITLIVDGVSGNSKADVNPTGHTNPDWATVAFEEGDKIYVGYNNAYVGYLTCTIVGENRFFNGEVSIASYDGTSPLHFYCLGGKDFQPDPSSIVSNTVSLSISDQSSSYPVISYATSKQAFTGAGTYTAKLENYCAIVKFTTPDIYGDVTITGMKNQVNVNFGAGDPYSFIKSGAGEITLHKASNTVRWAILLPQGEVTTATASAPNYVSASDFTVPAITADMYDNSGVSITLSKLPYVEADFSVADDRTVKFSSGNLQYEMSTGKFSFMEHQYSTVETSDVTADYEGHGFVSLFGWGTSGWSGGGWDLYQPFNTEAADNKYGPASSDLTGGYANADWGVYNKDNIVGSGNHDWRTLTHAEWEWLLGPDSSPTPGTNCRTSSTVNGTANARFTKATITTPSGNVHGLIIFPDSYAGGTPDGVTWGSINAKDDKYTATCTADGWKAIESAGCIFLPAAGGRNGVAVNYYGNNGFYWSTTHASSTGAYRLGFNSSNIVTSNPSPKHDGMSVRLVF